MDRNSPNLAALSTFYEGPEKCKCCINWVENYPTNIKEAVEKTSDAKRYAIICRVKKAHDVNSNDPLELHSIVVQSPSLKTILGDIFTGYPGITTTLNDVSFYAPFWEFFYRWEALTKAQADYGSESPEHKTICLLLTTLSSQLSSVHNVAKDLIQNSVITYDYLWILFAPGTLVQKTKYYQSPLLKTKTYDLHCRYIDWDGENFCWKTKVIKIDEYSGTMPIRDLKVYPVTYHNAPEDAQSSVLKRGHKFVTVAGCRHRAYRGIVKVSGESLFGSNELRISERVIIDAVAFAQHKKFSVKELQERRWKDREEDKLDPLPKGDLSDRLLMLCSPIVKAYGLRTKCWGEIYVDGISDIIWDENAFHDLVLEHETKRLVESVVSAQTKQHHAPEFDDIIEGKGQGVILLLTGEPGVGKTLTAETVTEKARRPLYTLSAGELGTSSDDLEKGLTKAFDLAKRWDAVLLLDESDVFLEERTREGLERNQLVSIFLRMLEYYRGIMFLTTNRASVIDTAFQSRIHLTLHYNGFNNESRRKVWQVLLERAHAGSSFSDEDLATLSEEPINGRQIKNAVKAAQLLATTDDVALDVTHINTVLRVMRKGQNPGLVQVLLRALSIFKL
ncbi:P-loop containing nucleoside triphosphate hydrolase protein [Hypoxylon rubiginosum]|uniref:P-loop containing nucleoside triphosphate hydrolase protein n=1 Tax=Hypoxylon rubiginosum TaxID=110542 RepID=A0ACC0CSE5_9PEZI|nr:P-loop containing nucleoside triphosphate hydrolase protein [Hypoxylon rubiginosum]